MIRGVNPRPGVIPQLPSRKRVPRVPERTVEGWSLVYAQRLYVEGAVEADQYEDLVGWVLSGGDLRLVTLSTPWPWRSRSQMPGYF